MLLLLWALRGIQDVLVYPKAIKTDPNKQKSEEKLLAHNWWVLGFREISCYAV